MRSEEKEMISHTSQSHDVTWGPWLLRLTLAGTLIFMWWLVIYDHGVVSHH
jgi:hypothetical protein